jgi:hypothetical protein
VSCIVTKRETREIRFCKTDISIEVEKEIYVFVFMYYTKRVWPDDEFYVLLTVHLGITLVNEQLVAQVLFFSICLFQFCTCFWRNFVLIIRRSSCINTTSGMCQSV